MNLSFSFSSITFSKSQLSGLHFFTLTCVVRYWFVTLAFYFLLYIKRRKNYKKKKTITIRDRTRTTQLVRTFLKPISFYFILVSRLRSNVRFIFIIHAYIKYFQSQSCCLYSSLYLFTINILTCRQAYVCAMITLVRAHIYCKLSIIKFLVSLV